MLLTTFLSTDQYTILVYIFLFKSLFNIHFLFFNIELIADSTVTDT